MLGIDGLVVEARDCGYTLRGRCVEYVSPAVGRRSGDCTRAAARVPGGSVTGNDDCGGVGMVPESPARDDVINLNTMSNVMNMTASDMQLF